MTAARQRGHAERRNFEGKRERERSLIFIYRNTLFGPRAIVPLAASRFVSLIVYSHDAISCRMRGVHRCDNIDEERDTGSKGESNGGYGDRHFRSIPRASARPRRASSNSVPQESGEKRKEEDGRAREGGQWEGAGG